MKNLKLTAKVVKGTWGYFVVPLILLVCGTIALCLSVSALTDTETYKNEFTISMLNGISGMGVGCIITCAVWVYNEWKYIAFDAKAIIRNNK